MGTKFTVYDSGLNPVKTTSSLEAGNLRQELAAICYVSQDPPQKRTFRKEWETSVCKRVFVAYRRGCGMMNDKGLEAASVRD